MKTVEIIQKVGYSKVDVVIVRQSTTETIVGVLFKRSENVALVKIIYQVFYHRMIVEATVYRSLEYLRYVVKL